MAISKSSDETISVAIALMAGEYKREDLCMEHLIREFGAWLKQGFGWLVDVIVFGCLWGINQVSRLLDTHLGGAPILKIVVLVLVLLLLVCTENSIRIDWGGNHVTSAHNDRAVMVLANVVRFAVEVEEPS